jgi:hypothetical protein
MNKFAERCAREDEEDRLASLETAAYTKLASRHLNGPDKMALVTSLLLDLVDEGVLAGWSVQFPERKEQDGKDA